MHEDLHNLKHIESEADTLYDTWRKYLYDWGARDAYWNRIIEQSEEFSGEYGDYGKHCIVARTQLLEKVWRERLGIAYSGLLDGIEQEEEKEIK